MYNDSMTTQTIYRKDFWMLDYWLRMRVRCMLSPFNESWDKREKTRTSNDLCSKCKKSKQTMNFQSQKIRQRGLSQSGRSQRKNQ